MTNLKNKVAAVFAASGDIAGAVAKSFAQHGAKVYVSGRDLKKVKALAEEIQRNGGVAVAAQVDAMDEEQIEQWLRQIVAENKKLDIVFNGIGLKGHEHGTDTPATDLAFETFLNAFTAHCGSQFLTSRAAARVMISSGSQGTILTLTAALSRGKFTNRSALTTACTAIEGLTRALAAELGNHGIRVVCLNATALPDTKRIQESFVKYGKSAGVPPEAIAAKIAQQNILKPGITLNHVAETAAFLVSDNGITLNSHIVDVDGGKYDVI
jgi:NAD(P)-dependent dehydrogenase (short-subunit alcohol dehydrogenase family)